jgi:large subunit ribosomal protein L11
MAKEINSILKLQIQAGKANPAPPIGPVLGQNGVPIQEFCTEFNNKTRDMGDFEVPVIVTVYKDRTFKLQIKQPTVASMIKKKLNFQKGSGTPNKTKVAKIKKSDLKEIAEKKLADFNTKDLSSAVNIVAGTAKSLGVEIKE